MKRRSRCLSSGLLTFMLWWGDNSASLAATPTHQIKETVDRVLAVLQDPTNMGEAKKAERREMLRQVLLPRFDFPEMAKRSLGSHWRDQNGKQEEYVSVFTDFMENSYIGIVESFKEGKIVFVRERVDKDFAEVDTKVLPLKEQPLPITYKLHLVGGEWKIYDVVIENVSLVNNYRSQFNRIISSASFDELLRKLREKASETGS